MSSYQLLTEQELLKLSIGELQLHYKLLMSKYRDLEDRKVIFVDKAARRKDALIQYELIKQKTEERDRENGSQAHKKSNIQVSEAIDLWKACALGEEFLNAYELGKLHNEETKLERRSRISRVPDHELRHPESANWVLSYSTYEKIYTAVNKAKRDPGIGSDDFHDAVLRFKK